MTEIYGSALTADHPYWVVWSNDSVTLKTGHGSLPAARHYARLIRDKGIGTVLSVTGPAGAVDWA